MKSLFFKRLWKNKDMYAYIFTCKKGGFSFRCLGVPMHFKELANSDWKFTNDKTEENNSSSKGNLTYY